MRVAFFKYEGLGNDFVLLEGQPSLSTDVAVALCDRHRGIGADGVLLVDVSDSAARMQVINADGSRPEMCGNGIRCVALHLVRCSRRQKALPFEIATDAGPHSCEVAENARSADVSVQMRPPSLEPAALPVVAERPVIDEPFAVGGAQLRLSGISMGNPHAVTFDAVDSGARAELGPLLEKHARFPNGVNVGFARVTAPQHIELAVWERGVGFTQACGTGACACAVAAVETGRAKRHQPIAVQLPGGSLQIVVREQGLRLSMTGPARHVFEGSIDLE